MSSQHIAYEKLVAFAAGELDVAEAKAVASHATFCMQCSQTVTHYKAIGWLLRTDDSQEPPLATIARAQAIFASKRSVSIPSQQPTSLPITLASEHVAYEKLVAFAGNELTTTEATSVIEHISVCTACSKTVNEFKTIRSLVHTDDSREPPHETVAHAKAIFTKMQTVPVPFWQRLGLGIPLQTARQFSMALMLVLFVLSNIILYTGIGRVVTEAQASIPGNSFYSAKLTLEDIQLATAWTTVSKLEKHLAYSGYRLDETASLISIPRLSLVAETLSRFENEVNLVSSTFKILAKENLGLAKSYAPKIESTLSGYSDKLQGLSNTTGDVIRPALEHALNTSNTIQAAVNATASQTSTSSSSSSVSSKPGTTPSSQTSQTPRPGSTGVSKPGGTATHAASSDSASSVLPQPQASQTPVPPPAVSTATRTPILVPPTATRIPTGQASKTLTPVVPTATVTPMPTNTLPPGLERQTVSPTPKNINSSKGN